MGFDELLGMVKTIARDVFVTTGQHAAQAIFIKQGRIGSMLITMRDDTAKEGAAGMLRNLRTDCELVCFVCEAWVGHRMDLLPRNDPERTEAVVLTMHASDGRSEIWHARITRLGQKVTLGPWVKQEGTPIGRFLE